MKTLIRILTAVVIIGVLSTVGTSSAQAGGSYSFGFGYSSGGYGRHYRPYYGDYCGPRYYPRSCFSYSYIYAPPPVVYYDPPPVYYAPAPPPPASYYYQGGVFYSY